MSYNWNQPAEALELIKQKILTAIHDEVKWYAVHRSQHAILSRTIRGFAIVLFSVGILLPITNLDLVRIKQNNKINDASKTTTKLESNVAENNEAYKTINIGYICLAFGGLILLLDKYLGISSGYVRFYIAELDIKKNIYEFESNWDIEMAKATNPMTTENILSLLNIVKQFKQSVLTTIQVETGAWATEFQTQTGELYELFKQKQSEYVKPAANISVSIDNYATYSGIELGIDSDIPIKLVGITSFIFRNVTIQPHLIKIQALNANGQTIAFSKNINVIENKTVEVIMTLP